MLGFGARRISAPRFLLSRALPKAIHFSSAVRPINSSNLDHVCIVSSDVQSSIRWYAQVLGLDHVYKNDKHFWPYCKESPAFLQKAISDSSGSDNSSAIKVAILPVESNKAIDFKRHRTQFGEHFALRVSAEEFGRAKLDLPRLLLDAKDLAIRNGAKVDISTDIEEADYGYQQSLFFKDIDGNIVELTMWL
jgi:catechol 2,3-dioxygenase-like lactoylglutathione lyase family enzyme